MAANDLFISQGSKIMVRSCMALILIVGISTSAKAVLVEDITLTFTPPTSTTNTLETTLGTDLGFDTQTATIISGSTVLVDLDCTCDTATRALTSVNYLNFVGGCMKLSEETYNIYGYIFNMNSVRGPFNTFPFFHGTATSGMPGTGPNYLLETTFPTDQHSIKLNDGHFTMIPPYGNGEVYDQFILSCNTPNETATLTTELDHIDGSGNAYYNVSMEFPVDFTATFYNTRDLLNTFACSGTLTAEGSFIMEEPNYPPVAVDDYYEVDKNSNWAVFSVEEGVLANDYDPNEGDTLTAEKIPIDYWTAPEHGIIGYYYEDGSFFYRPYPNFTGVDTFTYRVYDEWGLYDEGTVYIQVGSPISIPGDTNGDNVVNEADAAVLDANWLKPFTGKENGDFNGDGFVDATDASIMAANWGNHNEGEGNAVPEPSTIILLLTGLAAVGLTRRRAA